MRRLALLAAAFGLLATIGSTGARAAGHPDQLGQMRACTTGQLRCGAIVVTRGGRVLRTATPAALPAGFGPADYHKAYALPTTGATVQTVAIVDAYDAPPSTTTSPHTRRRSESPWSPHCVEAAALNVVMGLIAWSLPQQPIAAVPDGHRRRLLEWRVLILSVTLFLYSFGYGGITSFTRALRRRERRHAEGDLPHDAGDRDPGRRGRCRGRLGDRFGYKRVFAALPGPDRRRPGVPRLRRDRRLDDRCRRSSSASASVPRIRSTSATSCRTSAPSAAAPRSARSSRRSTPASAPARRRWAGSSISYGFAAAFGTAAALSGLALPYFLVADRALRKLDARVSRATVTEVTEGPDRSRTEQRTDRISDCFHSHYLTFPPSTSVPGRSEARSASRCRSAAPACAAVGCEKNGDVMTPE